MNRCILQKNLYLSGMDDHAADFARQLGLGLEITRFSWAVMLDHPKTAMSVRQEMREIQRFWLHAPFAEMSPCAVDPLVRQVTAKRYRQTIRTAQNLKISQLVIHSGFIPATYYPEWFTEQSIAFWREFLESAPPDMTIALENVMDPDPTAIVEIIQQVNDPRLQLCLDIGHANHYGSKLPIQDWITAMAPHLAHVHLHNNFGNWDSHNALDHGTIDMASILDALLELCPRSTFTIENQDCTPSLNWLQKEGYLT